MDPELVQQLIALIQQVRSMDLHLSRNSTTSTVLSAISSELPSSSTSSSAAVELATPLYHIYTPGKFTKHTTTISRISPSVARDVSYKFRSDRREDLKACTAYASNDVEGSAVVVEEVARIHWRMLGSKLVYRGKIIELEKFMPKEGLLWMVRTRSFTGPDGRVYTWHTDIHTSYLTTTSSDSEESIPPVIEVARYHQRPFGVPMKTKPYLEIKPEGMHVVELIVITWVFVETRRQDMERG